MSDKQLLGPSLTGSDPLNFVSIANYLLTAKKHKDVNAENTLTNICLSILERAASLGSLTKELSKEEQAHQDPTALGLANGLIMALNVFNGTEAGSNQLVHLPEKGFTHFNPMSVRTDPKDYYTDKETQEGCYILLGDVDVKTPKKTMDYVFYRDNNTGKVTAVSRLAFDKLFKKVSKKG